MAVRLAPGRNGSARRGDLEAQVAGLASRGRETDCSPPAPVDVPDHCGHSRAGAVFTLQPGDRRVAGRVERDPRAEAAGRELHRCLPRAAGGPEPGRHAGGAAPHREHIVARIDGDVLVVDRAIARRCELDRCEPDGRDGRLRRGRDARGDQEENSSGEGELPAHRPEPRRRSLRKAQQDVRLQ